MPTRRATWTAAAAVAVLIGLSLGGGPAVAKPVSVYQCTTADGELSFQDAPCDLVDEQAQLQLETANQGILPPRPRSSRDAAAGAEVAAEASATGMRKQCSGVDVTSFSPLGISLEFTTAPALDGFWGDRKRGFLERPDISVEQFNQDVNDVAICANIEFVLKKFRGRINKQNNLGLALRGDFLARSREGRISAARSGTFPDGSMTLGASYSGTFCFWRASEGGALEDIGCR